MAKRDEMLQELYIEFDGRQLVVRTNVEESRAYVAGIFEHMLAPALVDPIGSLEFIRNENGYVIEGGDRIEFGNVAVDALVLLLKDLVRLELMRLRPDLMWLHAGAVSRGGRGVLLSGPSGHGKSTITTLLCGLGWQFLSDDVAPVRMDSDVVLPFPQAAVRRLHPGREVTQDEVYALPRESVAMSSGDVSTSEVPIHAIVFIVYSAGRGAEIARLPKGSGAMEVLRNLTNFMDHRNAAVARAVRLAQSIPIFMLTYDSPTAAASAVNLLLSNDL